MQDARSLCPKQNVHRYEGFLSKNSVLSSTAQHSTGPLGYWITLQVSQPTHMEETYYYVNTEYRHIYTYLYRSLPECIH